jgi:hypothetical protein
VLAAKVIFVDFDLTTENRIRFLLKIMPDDFP